MHIYFIGRREKSSKGEMFLGFEACVLFTYERCSRLLYVVQFKIDPVIFYIFFAILLTVFIFVVFISFRRFLNFSTAEAYIIHSNVDIGDLAQMLSWFSSLR